MCMPMCIEPLSPRVVQSFQIRVPAPCPHPLIFSPRITIIQILFIYLKNILVLQFKRNKMENECQWKVRTRFCHKNNIRVGLCTIKL